MNTNVNTLQSMENAKLAAVRLLLDGTIHSKKNLRIALNSCVQLIDFIIRHIEDA